MQIMVSGVDIVFCYWFSGTDNITIHKVLREFLTQIIEANKTHNKIKIHDSCQRREK